MQPITELVDMIVDGKPGVSVELATMLANIDGFTLDDTGEKIHGILEIKTTSVHNKSIPFVSHNEAEVIHALYQLAYFSRNTLEDATGLDRDELKSLMQFLISSSIVEKAGPDYKRTPLGLAFIEQMLTNPASDSEARDARAKRFSKIEI